MKFLVIGLGSMGKRRIRNLKALGHTEIMGYDPRQDRREEAGSRYEIKTYSNVDEALLQEPQAMIISTPPDTHMFYANIAIQHNIHFFTEASVVYDEMNEIIDKLRYTSLVAAPSCTLRFHPAIIKLKELINTRAIGKISSFTYHSGQYLPDWHPWESIRDYYVSKRSTGGCREIVPFELTWLTWVFGDICNIKGYKGKTIDLGVDIDDVYQIIMRFNEGCVGHLMVDVVSRVAIRNITILGEEGVIKWDWNERNINIYHIDENEWQSIPVGGGQAAEGYNPNIIEEMYVDELQSFIDAINKNALLIHTMSEDKAILDLLYTVDESSDLVKK